MELDPFQKDIILKLKNLSENEFNFSIDDITKNNLKQKILDDATKNNIEYDYNVKIIHLRKEIEILNKLLFNLINFNYDNNLQDFLSEYLYYLIDFKRDEFCFFIRSLIEKNNTKLLFPLLNLNYNLGHKIINNSNDAISSSLSFSENSSNDYDNNNDDDIDEIKYNNSKK